jgi:hypothetical protein
MKTRHIKFILLFFVPIFLSSCTTLLYTSLDVLRPAKVNFDVDANDLLIVNNAAIQPSNYGHTAPSSKNGQKKISVKADSLSIYCLGALTEDIESKNFFKSIQLIPKSRNITNDFFNLSEFSDKVTTELCTTNHANVILSLDKIKVDDNLKEFYISENSTYSPSLEVMIETYWSVHYNNNPNVTKIQFKDTLYWESESVDRKMALKNLPKREDALVDAALYTGHNSVNRFIPYWDKVDRYLFNSPNKQLKKGIDSVYVKNWKLAISIWKSAYDKSKNNSLRARLSNNIAVAYEVTGDIDNALKYANDSFYLMGNLTIIDFNSFVRLKDYIEELKQRKKEIDILKRQLGN